MKKYKIVPDANLGGANLVDAKNYTDSYDFLLEVLHRQPKETFTGREWTCIGMVIVYRPCWDTIQKEYMRYAISVLKKVAKAGFPEYLEKLENIQ